MDGLSSGWYAPGEMAESTNVAAAESTDAREGFPLRMVLLAAVLLGIEVRALPIVRADFPLNDGGLLASMIADLQRTDYLMPHFSSYNEGTLPFFQPPLALYAAELLTRSGPIDVMAGLRLLPLLFTVLTLPAFWLLARAFLPGSRVGLTGAFLAFALLPASYQHLIMGGGVTRGLGMALALFALRQTVPMFLERDTRQVMLVLALSGLVVLCDLSATWFLTLSLGILLLTLGRDESGFRNVLLVAVGAALMSAPWWVDVLVTHGPGPLLAPAASSFVASALRPSPPFNALAAAGALLGLALCVMLALIDDPRGLILAWLLAIVLLDTGEVGLHSIPALCLGLGLVLGSQSLLLPWPLATRKHAGAGADDGRDGEAGDKPGQGDVAGEADATFGDRLHDPCWLRRMAIDLGMLALLLGFMARVYALPWRAEEASLQPVSAVERAAMHAAPESIPPGASVLVITGEAAPVDRVGEWFPTLSGRTNLVSPQALPWSSGGAFASRTDAHARAQACGRQDIACLERWERDARVLFTHVYVARRPNAACCEPLRASLRASQRYAVVYDGPGATVFARGDAS